MKRSPKKINKKMVFPGFGRNSVPKLIQDAGLRGGKSRPEGAKISPGGQLSPPCPLLPAPMLLRLLNLYNGKGSLHIPGHQNRNFHF